MLITLRVIEKLKARLEGLESRTDLDIAGRKRVGSIGGGILSVTRSPKRAKSHSSAVSLEAPKINTAAPGHDFISSEIGATSSTSLDSVAQMPSNTSSPSVNIRPSEFENIMRPITLSMNTDSRHEYQSSNSTATTVIGWAAPTSCSCDRTLDAMNCKFPRRRHADALVTLYFGRLNRIYPLLREDTFMTQWCSLWKLGSRSQASGMQCVGFCCQASKGRLFPVLANLVLALGSW
jgi:hypothetical protein